MSYHIHFGGGGTVLDQVREETSTDRDLRFFVRASEERLMRVKNGERLIPTVNSQKDKFTVPKIPKPEHSDGSESSSRNDQPVADNQDKWKNLVTASRNILDALGLDKKSKTPRARILRRMFTKKISKVTTDYYNMQDAYKECDERLITDLR
jgi:hypothetical protein